MRKWLGITTAIAIVTGAGPVNAQSSSPSQERLTLAREVLQEQGVSTQYAARIRSALSVQMQIMRGLVPADQATLADAMITFMAEEELKAVPTMLEDAATVYAENLSEAELRDMLAWSKSRSGKAFYAKVPTINQNLMLRQVPLMRAIVGGALSKAIERTCAQTACTTEQRQALATIADRLVKAGT